MLKKIIKLKVIFMLVLIMGLILTQFITAYIFGFKAQQQLNMQFKRMTDSPYIIVENYSYKRGFFSSDISAKLSLNSKALTNLLKILPNVSEASVLNHKYYIKYSTHVSQGIFAGIFNGDFAPTIAVARTNLKYPEVINSVFSKFFGNTKPLFIKNVIYLNKDGEILITSPAFNYEEALSGVKVIWGGLNLLVHYNQDFNQFNNTLSMPRFILTAPTKGKVELDSLHYISGSKYSVNQIKVGTTGLNVNKITVSSNDKANLSINLGDLLNTLAGISATQFLNGLDVIDPTNFSLSGIGYTSTSNDSNGYFNASTSVVFESLITESKAYGPLNLDLSVSHVLSAEFSKMIDELTRLAAESNITDDEGHKLLVAVLKKYFAPILVDSPIIEINNFRLKVPSGLIQMNGNFTTSGFTLVDINNDQNFLNKIEANVKFSVPKDVLSYLLMVQMRYLLSAGNAEMDKQSTDALKKVVSILLDSQLISWRNKGYISETSKGISSNLTYEHGKLLMKP